MARLASHLERHLEAMGLRIVIAPLIACLGVAGCGNAEGPVPDPPPEQVVPADGRGAIERSGKVAARLILVSPPFEPGDTIGVSVENVGEIAIQFGLGARIDRLVDGAWEDAREAVYGERHSVPAVGLIAPPGARRGPDYGQVADRIPLPSDLEPGIYRVGKRLGSDGSDASVTPRVSFRVR